MPSLKALKNRIASVKSTRKITKAMQMVAAAKLRRAQEAAEAARPYAERMNAVMSGLAAGVGGSASAPRLLSGTGNDKVHMLVVMTSERGLCGGFNSTIVRLARARARRTRTPVSDSTMTILSRARADPEPKARTRASGSTTAASRSIFRCLLPMVSSNDRRPSAAGGNRRGMMQLEASITANAFTSSCITISRDP